VRGLGAVRAFAVLALLAASGCASMSGQECRAGDWEAIGRADAERAAPGSEVERHRQACAKHDVAVNEDAWRAGYARGLEAFCTPKGGYLAGRNGQKHNDVCFGVEGEDPFHAAYGDGRHVHKLLGEIRELRQLKNDLEMAALSGDYGDYDANDMRLRAAQVEGALQGREWELDAFDQRCSKEYGVPPLARRGGKR
jgi:hypothetical protein